MWIHHKTAKKISELFYLIDQHTRNDLSNNLIADERDYTSRMISFFNYPFGLINLLKLKLSYSKNLKFYAAVNKTKVERLTGTDSIIIFKKGLELKICLFESKWPRVYTKPKYRWDKYSNGGISHFSSQIDRQLKINSAIVIWEMFYLEARPNVVYNDFDPLGSTCLLLNDIKGFINSIKMSNTRIWNNKLLNQAVTYSKSSKSNDLNIAKIIYNILICGLGDLIKIQKYQTRINLAKVDSENPIEIPILNLFENEERLNKDYINDLLTTIGINNFLQIEFSNSPN